jgi:hypothetical protein
MPLVTVDLIGGVLSPKQKQQIIEVGAQMDSVARTRRLVDPVLLSLIRTGAKCAPASGERA